MKRTGVINMVLKQIHVLERQIDALGPQGAHTVWDGSPVQGDLPIFC